MKEDSCLDYSIILYLYIPFLAAKYFLKRITDSSKTFENVIVKAYEQNRA